MGIYHINSEGNPGPCKAQHQCPFGDASEHYSSKDEARRAYEVRVESLTEARRMIPRDGRYGRYYDDTDRKHFTDRDAPGSKFTDPRLNSLDDVVALTLRQRGTLRGNDAHRIQVLGADPSALSPKFRYLLVQTSGKVGAQKLDTLPPNTSIRAVRTKTGGRVSLVAQVEHQQHTDFGVVIVGDPDGLGREQIITAHPGLPSSYSNKDIFAQVEGQILTREQVILLAGTSDVSVNTQLRR